MTCAHHFPTERFTRETMAAMPQCFGHEWAGRIAPNGYSLWKDSAGRLVVTVIEMGDTGLSHAYSVRPIVVVPANRG